MQQQQQHRARAISGGRPATARHNCSYPIRARVGAARPPLSALARIYNTLDHSQGWADNGRHHDAMAGAGGSAATSEPGAGSRAPAEPRSGGEWIRNVAADPTPPATGRPAAEIWALWLMFLGPVCCFAVVFILPHYWRPAGVLDWVLVSSASVLFGAVTLIGILLITDDRGTA